MTRNSANMQHPRYDFIVVGGGIIGLSVAWQLGERHPDLRILLLEKENGLARHQSGHNSGVVHAGVYYEPGSLKARFCREGSTATYAFCRENGIPFEQCGKLLVATSEAEQERMRALFERCRENGLEPEWLSRGQLAEAEPAVRGTGAFLVRESGIVDFRAVCRKMAEKFARAGGELRLEHEVTELEETSDSVAVITNRGQFLARKLVVCGGLMADRLAAMQGIRTGFRIVPIRGEYYRLRPEHSAIVRHLIYPIPDPNLPFLGVHLTRMIDGSVTVGPNAVQGWKREGYGRFNFSLRDTAELLGFPGFWKLARANLRHGIVEFRNALWKRGYLKQVHKYCPGLKLSDLEPHPAGIRAQAVLRCGAMVDDFLFEQTERSLHVCNAPSPAATSAIPIGRHICDRIAGGIC